MRVQDTLQKPNQALPQESNGNNKTSKTKEVLYNAANISLITIGLGVTLLLSPEVAAAAIFLLLTNPNKDN